MPESFGGYRGIPIPRGELVERDMFDIVKEEARINFEKITRELVHYVPYERAIEIVKGAQPVHPTRPSKPFAAALHDGLVEKLYGKSSVALAPKVKFFTAVQSALDMYHGTDAFLEINPDSGLALPKNGRVTLGVTTRDKGDTQLKTDVEIWVPEGGIDNDSELFYYAVSQVVEQVLRSGQGAPGAIVDLHE